ncbi:NAD(P)H-hydrate dehydratase [Tabrizicola sp.]|uniref:NAD(P)H-hydrate dehydratase n=1 Tax=Tabrizicola sp. TaxID=2005166 RepID=UPI0026326C93|nr:NAD(P)H-hydrate dehydratase [Tabrizicola sp.]MDM7930436.1 NAD(P)H-hydrate dehydratase [Tabrizicola sp.]
MTELLTAAQMRAIEQAAIASGEVTGLELMERAGRGVVEAIFEEWPELRATSHRAVVLCGPGNNGGDGFVVARLLKEWGWEVEVFLYGDPERLPPDARANYERWVGMGEVIPFDTEKGAEDAVFLIAQAVDQVLIDALFGIGLSRPLEGAIATLLRSLDDKLDESVGRYVAVDTPSGLCADSGRSLGKWPRRADLTVTFHRPKPGHMLADGPYFCGRVAVCDIGLPDMASKRQERVTAIQGAHPMLKKARIYAHKYAHGHALILSGPSGRGGAARLAARGALRIGAGVVTVGCPLDAIPENAARLDAVMLRGVADGAALAGVLEDQRINALCLGPGMGTAAREAGLVGVALGERRSEARPTSAVGRASDRHTRPNLVLDADAFTILSQTPDLFAALHDGCVLTPHAGEFARLFPDIAEKLAAPATKGPAYSKVDATREAAARAGCVVLYKGPDTVIADPTGRCAINSAHYDRAAPWLATAGAGDVLAGFITGLLARGGGPFDAACTGAWLHVEAALSFGPGLIAEDLAEELPKVFRALGV